MVRKSQIYTQGELGFVHGREPRNPACMGTALEGWLSAGLSCVLGSAKPGDSARAPACLELVRLWTPACAQAHRVGVSRLGGRPLALLVSHARHILFDIFPDSVGLPWGLELQAALFPGPRRGTCLWSSDRGRWSLGL